MAIGVPTPTTSSAFVRKRTNFADRYWKPAFIWVVLFTHLLARQGNGEKTVCNRAMHRRPDWLQDQAVPRARRCAQGRCGGASRGPGAPHPTENRNHV